MDEKIAIEFTAYKDTKGFERSLTIRGDSGTEVMERMDKAIEAIMEKGGTPIAKSVHQYSKPTLFTKSCPVHNVDMKEKISKKDGKPFYSHSKGVYPDLVWCSGKGFPDENDINF